MKNQYFGDFGDYQKFSLLKMLRDVGRFKITTHWMKTTDDGGADGRHIGYLKKPQTWNSFDKSIFDFIKKHVDNKTRNLALYEKSAHAIGIKFVNDHVENPKKRLKLLDEIRNDKKSNLIFFDPDNGIEVKSTNSRNVHKYVLWGDIETTFNSGKSVLIYQHFSRKNRDVFIKEKLDEMRDRFSADIFAIKVEYSVYFLLAQRHHVSNIRKSLAGYSSIWKSRCCIHDPRAKN